MKDISRKWMIVAALSFVIYHLSFSPAGAQVDTWKAYMSYYEPQQIVKAGSHTLFVRASNSLYSYNLNDESITTYDKVSTLNDTYVSLIGWNQASQRLIIVYGNSNIDIMDLQGNVTNQSALYSKSMFQDKTVNSIYMSGIYAYLATGFGVVKVNMQRAEIAESYILDQKVTAIGSDQTYLYLRTSNGTFLAGLLTKNLIDFHNWNQVSTVPEGTFATDQSDWDQYISKVRTLQPGGPKYSSFVSMRFINGSLYTCGNNIQVMKDGQWTIFNDDVSTYGSAGSALYGLDINPVDESHLFAASRKGLFEYRGTEQVNFYNQLNSPIESALNPNKYTIDQQKGYDMVTGVKFSQDGKYVWCLNSQAPTQALLRLDLESRQWTSFSWPELMLLSDDGLTGKSLANMKNMITDSRGYTWFVNQHWGNPSIHRFYTNDADFISTKCYYSFKNQNDVTFSVSGGIRCVCEDLNNDLWIGTSSGPLLLPKEQMDSDEPVFTQVVVPRNDGTNLADYLLEGVGISCMVVDPANRKWFGTSSNGVYVISADNMEQVYHFTTDNSPLLSNIIQSIAINNSTGEVFFGTDNGLCSYMSNTIESSIEMTNDNVYAYPNPVVSTYNGLITVVGLAFDSDVKIVSTSGQLVAEGRSNGGMFTWNGRDVNGHRVASGIYMVCAATSEGKKGAVCKIAVIR